MFDKIRKAIIQNREDDALLYEYVFEEIESGEIYKGLWAKAIAMSEGNDNKIKSLYMQYRVQSIKDEFTKLNIAYKEMSKDPLFRKITALYAEPTFIIAHQATAEYKGTQAKKSENGVSAVNKGIEAVAQPVIIVGKKDSEEKYDTDRRINEIQHALDGHREQTSTTPIVVKEQEIWGPVVIFLLGGIALKVVVSFG